LQTPAQGWGTDLGAIFAHESFFKDVIRVTSRKLRGKHTSICFPRLSVSYGDNVCETGVRAAYKLPEWRSPMRRGDMTRRAYPLSLGHGGFALCAAWPPCSIKSSENQILYVLLKNLKPNFFPTAWAKRSMVESLISSAWFFDSWNGGFLGFKLECYLILC